MLGFVRKALGGGFDQALLGGWSGGSLASLLEAMGGSSSDRVTDPLRQHVWVYACIRARARALGSTPLVLRTRPDDDAPVLPESDPLAQVLERPHPLVSSQRLWQLHSALYDIYGCVHWLLYDSNDGKRVPSQAGLSERLQVPAEIVPVPGPTLKTELDRATGLPARHVITTGGVREEFGPGGVVTFRDISGGKLTEGVGAVEALGRRILADYSAESLDIHATQNGGLPSMLFSSPEMLHEQSLEQMRAALDKWISNPKRHNKPALLHGGLKLENSAFAPKDMENATMRKWSRDGIMAVFGVTAPILGITDDVNRANAVEAKAVFWEDTLIPQQQLWLSELSDGLLSRLTGRRVYASFDRSGVEALQASEADKIERALTLHERAGLPLEKAAAVAGWDLNPEHLADPAGNVVDEASAKPDATLNGAQMAQVSAYIKDVALGLMPREAAVQALGVALPISEERARRMLASVVEGAAAPEPPAPLSGERSVSSRNRAMRAPMDKAAREAVQRDFEAFLEPREQRMERAVAAVQRDYIGAVRTKLRQVANGERAVRPRHPEVAVRALEDDVPEEVLDELERMLFPAITGWQDRTADAVRPLLAEFYFDGVKQLADDLGVDDLLPDTDVSSIEFLSTRTIDLAEGTVQTLQTDLRNSIARELFERGGEYTIADIQERLVENLGAFEDLLDAKAGNISVRAQRIARTETAGAVNAARVAEMEHLGIGSHEWSTASDDHVRESHGSVDGEVREIGEAFSNGLRHPNDFSAPASEVVNCRCSTWPIDEDVEAILADEEDNDDE